MRQYHDGMFDDGGLHVTRHTVATCLSNELSVDDRAIERLLHHTSQDVTRQRYNCGWPGGLMRSALQSWVDHVSEVDVQSVQEPACLGDGDLLVDWYRV